MDYDCGWFEVLGTTEFEEGDEIHGDFTSLDHIIVKSSTGEKETVFVEYYGLSMKKAIEIIMN